MSIKLLSLTSALSMSLAMPAAAHSAAAPPTSSDGAKTIEIIRDRMGVPHVYADTRNGLYYGGAYAIAQDRLAEGEMAIRQALGRAAEILGPSAVQADREARYRMMSDAETQAQFGKLDKRHQDALRAMYDGWMAYSEEVRQDPRKLPYEFKEWGIQPGRWTLWDFLNAMSGNFRKYMEISGREGYNLAYYKALAGKFGEREAKVIFDDTMPLDDPDAVPTVPMAEDQLPAPKLPTLFDMQAALPSTQQALSRRQIRTLSRTFIIGKSRTANGHPIVLQATADGPTVHLSGAGINVAGWFWVPFGPMLMGRSDKYAFLMTATGDDIADVFVEKLNPRNPRQYFYDGAWRDMEVRPQTIEVKGGPAVRFDVEYTVHGPVMERLDRSHAAYAKKHALHGHELAGLAAMVDSNAASAYPEWRSAIERNTYNFNYYYAGEDGTISFMNSGAVPLRDAALDRRLPTPGTGEFEWKGLIPSSQHPQITNPKQDYLFNWNSKTSLRWMDGDGIHYGKAFRAWLPPQLLQEKPDNITLDDAYRFHRALGESGHDLTNTNPRFFTPYLRPVVANDPRLAKVVEAMDSWNAEYEDKDADGFYDNPGLTIYRKWAEIALKQIIGDDLNDINTMPGEPTWNWESVIGTYSPNVLLRAIQGQDAGLPMKHDWFNGQDRAAVLRKTLSDTAEALRAEYKTDDVSQWKHRIFYRYYDCSAIEQNPDKPHLPGPCLGGNEGLSPAIMQTAARLGLQPKFVPNNMSEAWSTVMEISPKDKALHDATPTGGQNMFIDTSGKGNPNIADQIEIHRNFKTKTVELEREKVVAGAVSKQMIRMVSQPR